MPDRQTINAAIERWVFGDDLDRGGFPLESWRAEPRDFHTWDAVMSLVISQLFADDKSDAVDSAFNVMGSHPGGTVSDVLAAVLEAVMPPAEFAKLMGDQP